MGPFTRPYLHSNFMGPYYFSLILNRPFYELGGLSSIGGISSRYGIYIFGNIVKKKNKKFKKAKVIITVAP